MLCENKNVKFIKYGIFDNFNCIKCLSSTRYGGISKIEYLSSMNLGFKTDDTRENVIKNYKIFCDATDIDIKDIVFSSQFHNDEIKVATQKDRGKGIFKALDYENKDALITNEKNVALTVFSADCVPVMYFDSKNKVIAAAHCGWGGTIKNLASKVIKTMIEKYKTEPKDIFVAIGPAIKSCCYEVSADLYEKFIYEFDYIEKEGAAFVESGKYFLDLPLINAQQLKRCGVENIEISDLCTSCNCDFLFSHRKSGGKRGIMAHIIELV